MDDGKKTDAERLLALMRSHRTIRKFTDAPVPDGLVRECVEAAQCASTSSNVQGYAIVRLRDAKTRARLVEMTGGQPQVAQAGAFFVLCADQRRHELAAEDEKRAYEGNLETFLVDVIDTALFAQNLALAFEAHGLGICFIGGLRNELPEVDRMLALPHGVLPLFGMCVGEPDDEPMARPRLPVEAVLCEERYPRDAEMREQMDRYDAVTRDYYLKRAGKPLTWRGGVARKHEQARRPHLYRFFESKGVRWR